MTWKLKIVLGLFALAVVALGLYWSGALTVILEAIFARMY